jgi:hypothetical protein
VNATSADVGLLDAEVAASHLRLERSIDQRDVASLPAASTALARDRSPRRAANRLKRGIETWHASARGNLVHPAEDHNV